MKARVERLCCLLVVVSALICLTLAMAESAFAENIDEGTTGTCKWELYKDGASTVLKISAKDPSVGGAMANYSSADAPWSKYREQVDKIEFSKVSNIGNYSFYNFTGISKVVIYGVQRIGNYAFAHCYNVAQINIYGDNCVIEDNAFAFCENVVMKEVVISGVKSIGDEAFEEVDCHNLILEEGIQSIGMGAFNNNEAVDALAIPYSCTSIGDNAFISCPELGRVFIMNPECTLKQYSFDKDYTTLFVYKNSTALDYAKQYGFTYYVIGDNGRYTLDLSKGEVKLSAAERFKSKDFLPLLTIEYIYVSKLISVKQEGNIEYLDLNNDGKSDVIVDESNSPPEVIFREDPKRSIGGDVKIIIPEEFEEYADENGIPYYGTFIFKLNKAVNPLYAKGKTASAKRSRTVTLKRSKVMTVKKNKGKLSFRMLKGNKKISINKKTGKITVKKGLKKKTYSVTVKVSAAGDKQYKAGSKKIKVKIRVK